MKERPILFSAPMVRAILDGRKTQTRRIIKPQPELKIGPADQAPKPGDSDWWYCPYGEPGDRLWVRENTEACRVHDSRAILSKYCADGALVLYSRCQSHEYNGSVAHWDYSRAVRPSIHMPRWASRINLLIRDVRVERLQDISEKDAAAEGHHWINEYGGAPPIDWFFSLWRDINGDESFSANPWVWVVEFERIMS